MRSINELTANTGTQIYAAPGVKYDISADIYSLGIILFELITIIMKRTVIWMITIIMKRIVIWSRSRVIPMTYARQMLSSFCNTIYFVVYEYNRNVFVEISPGHDDTQDFVYQPNTTCSFP